MTADRSVRAGGCRWGGRPWAAAVWAIGFAVGSLYLAAGGTGGLDLVAVAVTRRIQARAPAMVVALWVTDRLKLAAALALSALHAWSGWGRRGLLVLLGTAGVLFVLWGGADVVRGALVAAHVLQAPPGWGSGPCSLVPAAVAGRCGCWAVACSSSRRGPGSPQPRRAEC